MIKPNIFILFVYVSAITTISASILADPVSDAHTWYDTYVTSLPQEVKSALLTYCHFNVFRLHAAEASFQGRKTKTVAREASRAGKRAAKAALQAAREAAARAAVQAAEQLWAAGQSWKEGRAARQAGEAIGNVEVEKQASIAGDAAQQAADHAWDEAMRTEEQSGRSVNMEWGRALRAERDASNEAWKTGAKSAQQAGSLGLKSATTTISKATDAAWEAAVRADQEATKTGPAMWDAQQAAWEALYRVLYDALKDRPELLKIPAYYHEDIGGDEILPKPGTILIWYDPTDLKNHCWHGKPCACFMDICKEQKQKQSAQNAWSYLSELWHGIVG